MRALAAETATFEREIEMVRIRFPNDGAPLSGCEAGTILYVFADGDLTVCPYLVFAARTPRSRHEPEEFIVGNVFEHADIAAASMPIHASASRAERSDLRAAARWRRAAGAAARRR